MGTLPWAMQRGSDEIMRGMVWPQCTGSKLLAQHTKMEINGQQFSFPLEMTNTDDAVITSDDAYRRSLNTLKLFDVERVSVRAPYWGCKSK